MRIASEEENELGKARGASFAAWLRHGLESRGWSLRRLGDECEISHSNLALYMRGGYDQQNRRYRRPREHMIDTIAKALGTDPDEGRRAAGYQERGEALLLPDRLAKLPPDAIRALLNFLDAIEAQGRPGASPG